MQKKKKPCQPTCKNCKSMKKSVLICHPPAHDLEQPPTAAGHPSAARRRREIDKGMG